MHVICSQGAQEETKLVPMKPQELRQDIVRAALNHINEQSVNVKKMIKVIQLKEF
jgi:hypothetical protein